MNPGSTDDFSGVAKTTAAWQAAGKSIVFTNGTYDLIHPGHIRCLREAASLGDCLIVGVNSDDSTRRLKGPTRPLLPASERCKILSSFEMVDLVVMFDDDTPLRLIEAVQPDVLLKGGDYEPADIVGYDTVTKRGGKVLTAPFAQGFSSSGIIDRVLKGSQTGR